MSSTSFTTCFRSNVYDGKTIKFETEKCFDKKLLNCPGGMKKYETLISFYPNLMYKH